MNKCVAALMNNSKIITTHDQDIIDIADQVKALSLFKRLGFTTKPFFIELSLPKTIILSSFLSLELFLRI